MFQDFSKAVSGVDKDTRPPHPMLDADVERERKKLFSREDFPAKVQELLGNTDEKMRLMEKRKNPETMKPKDWSKLRKLETAPMDKDLFRKVCRTAVAEKLIQSDNTSLTDILPKKASKIGDDWAIPSPDNCAKILNVFSKIKPPEEKKPDPYAKLDAMPESSKKGKPASRHSFESLYPSQRL